MAGGDRLSPRRWMVVLLFLMFASSVGIGTLPGNVPAGSLSVLGFLAAVLGVITVSLLPQLRSLVDRGKNSSGAPPVVHRGHHPTGFRDTSLSFWARLKAASTKMAPPPAVAVASPGLTGTPGPRHDSTQSAP